MWRCSMCVVVVHRRAVRRDKPLVVALDVKVQAPSQILVQGRGLDAEMGGELHVFGTADSPRVTRRVRFTARQFHAVE